MKHFDLTKRETLSKAVDFVCQCNPMFALGKYVFDKIFGENPSPEEQRKTARKGRKDKREDSKPEKGQH